ncbi:cytochrome P450 [Lactifluus subvellereus]|nr:cytochrome P450 [Lactifluus subvellereus]
MSHGGRQAPRPPMNTQITILLAILAVSVLLARTYIRRRNSFLRTLQGPQPSSLLFGSDVDFRHQNEVGDCEFKWARQYGSAWRQQGCFGIDRLAVADPKTLQYILHTSAYHFIKPIEVLKSIELLFGKGIAGTHGEVHQRQRKIMTPAFFAPQLRTFLSLFQNSASKLVQIWKEELITTNASGQPLVNVTGWLSRTTLDIIGEAGFGFQFGSLDNTKTPLREQYENLFVDSFLYSPRYDLLFKALWRYMPKPLLDLVPYLPTRQYTRFRKYTKFMRKFSRGMIKESMIKDDGKDIMSVLLRANASENPNGQLTEIEVIDQINNLLFAGHDTTANSLTWYLWEIAKHPESQERVRTEIAAVRAKNGGGELSAADLDNMTFTQATLKESMRLHPIVYWLRREASRDDVIPLALPITTKSGEQVTSIPVKKGTQIDIAIDVYNRLPEVWGPDADDWNPERFLNLDKSKQTSIGVFANLMNFSGGVHSCIGWRFAVLEMQLIAVTLLENFEFSLPPQTEKTRIYRKPAGLMLPMTEGERGAWMGLVVKSVD